MVEAEPQVGNPEFVKAAGEAFGTLLDKLAGSTKNSASSSYTSSENRTTQPGDPGPPKSLFINPFALVDTMGVGYRASPQSLTYETLRAISEKDTIVASVINRRVNQISAFAQLQPNKYSIGFDVHQRGRKRSDRMTKSQREKADYIVHYIQNTGRDVNLEHSHFTDFLKKFVRDSLTYDAGTFEKRWTRGADPYDFFAVDASTIRFKEPLTPRGEPLTLEEQRTNPVYLQYEAGQVTAEYYSHEMAYCVRNPRTSTRVWRYGFPELEVLINTVTSHLNAEAWNRNIFINGSTTPGFLNVKGRLNQEKITALERAWHTQVTGPQNAHRLPIINAEDLQFVPINWNNEEMGFQAWLEYTIKLICSVYGMDPAEIQFDLRGGVGTQPMFMSSNEAQQKVSRDQGLNPLLKFVADTINRHVVWAIDPGFEFSFVGLDAKTEEQNYELRSQQVQTTHTLNEARALEGLNPVPNGDVVLNPVYIGYLEQQAMAAQQAQAGGDQEGGPDGEPPPTEEDRAFLSKPGAEERQAASRMMQFGDQPDKKQGDDQDDAQNPYEALFQGDWTSSIHASQKPGDLRKSLYEVFPLD